MFTFRQGNATDKEIDEKAHCKSIASNFCHGKTSRAIRMTDLMVSFDYWKQFGHVYDSG